MACTLEKVLGDARTLLERLKEHDTAAEGLIEQSGALSQRVQGMREVGNALPDKVRTSVFAKRFQTGTLNCMRTRQDKTELTSQVWSNAALYPFTSYSFSLQHIEDTSEIQELTKYKPHVLLTQENTQIKELQQENKGENKSHSIYCITPWWTEKTTVVDGPLSLCCRD